MMRLLAASPVLISSIDFAKLLRALRVLLTRFQRTAEHSITLQLAAEEFSNGCTSTNRDRLILVGFSLTRFI